ncbi:chemotaxis protein MotB [Hydrogenivirga caldilitoris]|uniref:Chemotaxis protein MotB n=1 Tax=Hydrogenivirga caldilitoris TaxID=246264 RepID=A0A497XX61_9AQUI|nr:flagellar motor protein MotB [Hydrogenivirga caldilitoris]RLJ71353.1 chemotaxis protein MotB [Hydrogenivirga caldilitoris]
MATRKRPEECPKPPAWLTSFGDLMSLLLTFFILLYSMSIISLEKFYQVLKGLVEAFGGRQVVFAEGGALKASRIPVQFENMHYRVKKFAELKKEITQIKKELMGMGIEADYLVTGTCMKLRVNTSKLFPLGSEEPYPQAKELFLNMCTRLKPFSLPITFEGYTDSMPVSNPRFPSNWELSAMRAVSVLKLFASCGYPQEILSAVGRGEYHPIAPNDTPENREKNRRIEFCIKLNP